MPDLADQADGLIEFQLELAIAAARGIPATVQREYCADCGDEIPQARRKAVPGVTRCLSCAVAREQSKLRGLV
jgi:phage/conjugal plasmid C-4 type zinc finger TraR family protein